MHRKKIVKKPSNFIEVKMTVYKENDAITRKELSEFNKAFVEMIEERKMICGDSIGLIKERN